MSGYCKAAIGHPWHAPYHDHEYGFPVRDDAALLERFALEINQAGLSWLTMLMKREGFRKAFRNFDVDKVARFTERDRERLMNDAGIVRNRLKINAVIENAKRIRALRKEFGSFAGWLDAHHPLDRDEWRKLFKKTFLFTGGEIVNELLLSTGYLPGAHSEDCPIYPRILASSPPWLKSSSQ